jgi:type III secretion protein J
MKTFATRFARIACMLLIGLALAGCRAELFSQLSEDDANEVLDTLYAAGIEARKLSAGESKFTVEVEQDQLHTALRITRERGLPRKRFADLGTLFKKEGLVSTPSEERMRFIYGMSQELSSTLTSIDGVISARVHPVIPANDPMADVIKPASAAVFIKHDPNANVQALAPAIKNLVMRGIEGLSADNIALTFVAADPPARRQAAAWTLPAWLALALATGGALLLVLATLLGVVLWRYRALDHGVQSVLAPHGAAPGKRGDWLRRLLRGVPPAFVRAPSNEERFEAQRNDAPARASR